MKFTYQISGHARDGQTWEDKGTVETPFPDIMTVTESVMRESFKALTQGKAIYGNPGAGCRGPYTVTKIVIEREP